jgi:endonuclease YncB( thermonuclease family)
VQGERADQAILEAWSTLRKSNSGAQEMTLTKKSFLTIFIALVMLWPHTSLYAKNLFTVTRVHDGDTITSQGYGIVFKVRLAGIDAPEKGIKKRPDQPYAEEARKYLENLILGKKVTIKQIALDRRNLIVSIVHIERPKGFFSSSRQEINLEMVKQGYAKVLHETNTIDIRPYKDIRPYREAEKEAKAKKLNIWSRE